MPKARRIIPTNNKRHLREKLSLRALALFASLTLVGAATSFGQAERFDLPIWTINQSAPLPGALYPMLAYPGAGVQICATWNPSVAACTTLATTYASASGSACPSNAQLVSSQPGSSCSGVADAVGGVGGFAAPGTYAYVLTTTYGAYGPYVFGVDAAGAYCPLAGCAFTDPVTFGPTTFNVQTLAQLQSAITLCSTSSCSILITANIAIPSNLSIPSNIALIFGGGQLQPATSTTLTIPGAPASCSAAARFHLRRRSALSCR